MINHSRTHSCKSRTDGVHNLLSFFEAGQIEKFFLQNMHALLEATITGVNTSEGELLVAPLKNWVLKNR